MIKHFLGAQAVYSALPFPAMRFATWEADRQQSTLIEAGLHSVNLDPDISDIWVIYPGTTVPASWASYLGSIDLRSPVETIEINSDVPQFKAAAFSNGLLATIKSSR